MNIALWSAQGILALVFLSSGLTKSLMSPEKMAATGQTGVAGLPLPFIRFIAICELFGSAGLILPEALGIYRFLTPLAAAGLGIIMIGAARIHIKLREPKNMSANFVLLSLCIFVIYGRYLIS